MEKGSGNSNAMYQIIIVNLVQGITPNLKSIRTTKTNNISRKRYF